MNRLSGLCLLGVVVIAAACVRTLTGDAASSGAPDDVRTSGLAACANACLADLDPCDGDDARCAAERSHCFQACAPADPRLVYAFYCQAEAYTRRGLVLSDDSCVGAAGGALEEQRSGCERDFEPPAGAFAYTVNCTPVMSWVGAASGEGGPPSPASARVAN